MTRRAIGVWSAALAFSMIAGPALAGQEKGSRPAGGGEKTGSAVSRPSGGSGGSSGGGSSAGSSSSSGGGSSSSMPSGGGGGRTAPSSRGSDREAAPRAPERRDDRAVARDRAGATRSDRSAATRSAAPEGASDQRRAVPVYSRPRDGRPVTGGAVDRRFPPTRPGDNGSVIYYPYYDPFYGYGYGSRYGYSGYYPWYAGYGFGLGYFYDPWGYNYNYYSPYDSYGAYSYGRGSYSNYRRGPVGQIRLKVKPQEGQVYVDGYYVGEVDSFDGVFQRLDIEAGAHRVEVRAPGYETVAFDVMVRPGETVTYKGELRRIR